MDRHRVNLPFRHLTLQIIPLCKPHLILDGHALQVQKPLFPSAHWTEEPKKGRERRVGLSLPDGCDADTGGDSLPVQTVW